MSDGDHFQTLGLEPSFTVDLTELASRQRELSRTLHPDKFVGRPSGERRQALGRAIEVNEAYRALKNPLTRAECLIALLGVSTEEGAEPPAPPELLMDMMEKREELRDAGRAANSEKVENLNRSVKKDEAATLQALGEAFDSALRASQQGEKDERAGRTIFTQLSALRYYRRFFDEAEAILDELC